MTDAILLPRGKREELPSRREAETFQFEHGGLHYTSSIGRYGDGRLAEVFLRSGREGALIGTLSHDAAILLSFGLQYGCPAAAIRRALLRNPDSTAAGPIGVLLDRLAQEAGA